MGTVIALDDLPALANRLRAEGQRIVLTNGCFDLLHVGHLRYLKAAKALGDVLVVGVNGDATVGRLKGPGRPFVPAAERVELVAGLEPVDYALVFETPTAADLLLTAKPDVYVKGGDYHPGNLPEAEAARSVGTELVFVPLVKGRSTTMLAAKVRGQEEGS